MPSQPRIYWDYNASAPLLPEAREAMLPWLGGQPGNASSIHQEGRRMRDAVDEAAQQVAQLIGASAGEIIFTSGGTESNNLAISGALEGQGGELLTSTVEHASVLAPCRALAARGWRSRLLSVDRQGRLDLDAAREALTPETRLATLQLANNETGVLFPIALLAQLAHERGALFHTDAIQAVGRIPVDVGALGVDYLSLSAHKIGGPQGVGALYVRKGAPLRPMLVGGAHQRGRRGGTLNVAGIVGLGAAACVARATLEQEGARQRGMIRELRQRICQRYPHVVVNGDPETGLPNTINLSFPFLRGETLAPAMDLEGVAVSAGSACDSGASEPSHVLMAMGQDAASARRALRISIGRGSAVEEIAPFMERLDRVIRRDAEVGP